MTVTKWETLKVKRCREIFRQPRAIALSPPTAKTRPSPASLSIRNLGPSHLVTSWLFLSKLCLEDPQWARSVMFTSPKKRFWSLLILSGKGLLMTWNTLSQSRNSSYCFVSCQSNNTGVHCPLEALMEQTCGVDEYRYVNSTNMFALYWTPPSLDTCSSGLPGAYFTKYVESVSRVYASSSLLSKGDTGCQPDLVTLDGSCLSTLRMLRLIWLEETCWPVEFISVLVSTRA